MPVLLLVALVLMSAMAVAAPINIGQGNSHCGAYEPYYVQYECHPDTAFAWQQRGDTFELTAYASMAPGEFGWKRGETLLQFALTTAAPFDPSTQRVDYTIQTTYTRTTNGGTPVAEFTETYRSGAPDIDMELVLEAWWDYNDTSSDVEVTVSASAMLFDLMAQSVRPVPVELAGTSFPSLSALRFGTILQAAAAVPAAQTPEPQAWQLVLMGAVPLAWKLRNRRTARR